ncbi:MAG: DUF11 domain-containing protein, partial [Candidatus Peregrinibacteria bacterium]|nr:DUF11 domain-containing protein [Candidatus Peregrinibacteria bacterium]
MLFRFSYSKRNTVAVLAVIALPIITYACGIPDMEITKTLDGNPQIVNVGDVLSYSIRIRSKTTNAAGSQMIITDTPSSGLTFIPEDIQTSSPYSCFRTIPGYGIGCYLEGPITDKTVKIRFRVTEAAKCSTVTNTVRIAEMNEPDPNTSNNQSTVSTSVRCNDPEISLKKTLTIGSPSVEAGERVQYELRVKNLDTYVSVHNVKIVDTIPEGLAYNAAKSSPHCSQQAQAIVCSTPEIQKNNEGVFRIEFTVLPTIVYPHPVCTTGIDNSAYATTDEAPKVYSDTVHLPVDCPVPNVTLRKEVNKTSVKSGEAVEYNIIIKNTGAARAQGVEIFDILPTTAGVQWNAGQSDNRCSYASDKAMLYCQLGTLEPGKEVRVSLTFDITDSAPCNATFSNSVRLNSLTQTNIVASSPETTILCDLPILSATKEADKTEIDAGERIIYTIRIQNSGNGDAKDVVIEDP